MGSQYQEIAGSKTYIKYKDCEAGDVLVEGKFRRDFQGRFGIQYEFEKDNGDIVVLNSAGHLNYKMDFISEGMKVKIIYDGVSILENGPMKGKSAHQFKVFRDMSEGEIEDNDDFGFDEFDGELDGNEDFQDLMS